MKPKRQLERTRREREAEARKRDRAAIRTLRKRVAEARRYSGKNCRRALRSCAQAKRLIRARRRAALATMRAQIELEAATALTKARQDCEGRKGRCLVGGESRVARALAALDAERVHQAKLALYERAPRQRKAAAAARRVEHRAESDSEVENSLPSELVIVWRAVKRRITGTEHRSRLESFLEWVESHKAEVQEIFDEDVERYVKDLSAREAELRERAGDYRHMSDAQLDEVPF